MPFVVMTAEVCVPSSLQPGLMWADEFGLRVREAGSRGSVRGRGGGEWAALEQWAESRLAASLPIPQFDWLSRQTIKAKEEKVREGLCSALLLGYRYPQ